MSNLEDRVISFEMVQEMSEQGQNISVSEMCTCFRICYEGNNLSNNGTDETLLIGRKQVLASGQETSAISGGIQKHYNGKLMHEYILAEGAPLCPACESLRSERIAALIDTPEYNNWSTMEQVLSGCCLCDSHGMMVPSKRGAEESASREGIDKHSLFDFAMMLALPDTLNETMQIKTRNERGLDSSQMIMERNTLAAWYAGIIRYKARGIGVDTERWELHVKDPDDRRLRHRINLEGLRDQLLSPAGARMSDTLPHPSGLQGAIGIQTEAGRAPMYSPLKDDFVQKMIGLARGNRLVFPFNDIVEYDEIMEYLIQHSYPVHPTRKGEHIE